MPGGGWGDDGGRGTMVLKSSAPARLIKTDGSEEPFDRKKIARSMRAAGASARMASEVAKAIETDGSCATTMDVRAMVMDELGARDPAAASLFAATRRPVVRRAIEAVAGIARLPSDMASSMGLAPAEPVEITTDARVGTLMTELNVRTAIRGNEVRLNAADLLAFDVEDGDRALMRRIPPDEDGTSED